VVSQSLLKSGRYLHKFGTGVIIYLSQTGRNPFLNQVVIFYVLK